MMGRRIVFALFVLLSTCCSVQGNLQKILMKKIDNVRNLVFSIGDDEPLKTFEKENGDQPDFFSTTISARLQPFQGEMTEIERTTFQNGVRDFLQNMLLEEVKIETLYIVTCVVMEQEASDQKDLNTLNLQGIVTAQYRGTDTDTETISEENFGEIIVNIMNVFDDRLINVLRKYENSSMISDGEATLKFNDLERVTLELVRPEVARKRVGLTTIIISSCIGACILLMLATFFKRKRLEEKLTREPASLAGYQLTKISKDGLSSMKNIQDFVNKDSVSYSPYADVQLDPPKRQRKNKYSKLTVDVEDKSIVAEDQETGISEENPLSSSDGNISFEEDTIVSKLSNDSSTVTAECYAPPGKLGVAIDTVSGNPVVHRVRDGSPLAGVLRRLDVIIAVDDVDTTSMSAAEVTSLMTKKMGKCRKITYMRGEEVQQYLMEQKNSFS